MGVNLLLTEHCLCIIPDGMVIPTEIFHMVQDMQYFKDDSALKLYLAENVDYDILYEFKAEKGIEPGVVYYKK